MCGTMDCFAVVIIAVFCTQISINGASNVEKAKPPKDLGDLYCDGSGKLTADDQMKATHDRCPADPKAKKINWNSVNVTNCKQILELGGLFGVQYECMYRLYGAISANGSLVPEAVTQYANAFHPRRASNFMKSRLLQCVQKYSEVSSGLDKGFGNFWRINYNWIKFSACQISAELQACNSRRNFSNPCDSE